MDKKTIQILSSLFLIALLLTPAGASENAIDESRQDPIPELDCVIEPSEIVDVGSAVPGVVESILADRSDMVKKGAVLAELESSVEQATLDLAKARAQLNTSIELRQESAALGHLTQQRNQSLLTKKAISIQDMDQLKTETRIAELQVKHEQDNKLIAGLEYQRAQAILHRRVIRSPVNGVVVDRFKSVGEYVEDESVLRLAQLDPLFVEVIVPVEYLGQVKPGMQAEVTAMVPGFTTRMATVERVDRVVDAASGTYGVRLNLANPDYQIPAGLRCSLGFLPMSQQQSSDELAEESDVSETEIKSHATESVSDHASIASVGDQPASCYSIGPLTDQKLIRQLTATLELESSDVTIRDKTINLGNRYLVLAITGTEQNSVPNLQTRMQAAGITDRFVMLQGDHKGRLSVGFYRKLKTAKKRQQRLAVKGIETEVLTIPRKKKQYYLDLSIRVGNRNTKWLKKISAALPSSMALESRSCQHLVVHE